MGMTQPICHPHNETRLLFLTLPLPPSSPPLVFLPHPQPFPLSQLITFVPKIFINTFVLIDPSGAPILRYNKTHLFPSVEDDVLPGSGSLPVVDTELGRMSVAVCLDMQFPALIRQAGRQGYVRVCAKPCLVFLLHVVNLVDILLEPSWSWGATGHLLSDGDAVRAAENGLTLLRCCSVGVSGVVSPH
ncbi:unnamed protein product [Closterium sp. Naga37s-1]|nr:unnamed protein product [Closterium sp. Naga37s-1]